MDGSQSGSEEEEVDEDRSGHYLILSNNTLKNRIERKEDLAILDNC